MDKFKLDIEESPSMGCSSWVVEMENTISWDIDPSVETARWIRHSIYQVPERIKNQHNTNAYRPELVSLGPFHHGQPDLLPMEEHKRRAVAHLVKRSGKPLREFVATVAEVTQWLQEAYKDLGDEWRGPDNRQRFVELMVTDGCFLLEALRMDGLRGETGADYAPSDPVFGEYGYLYLWPYIRSDMVVLENQLPLRLLHRLLLVVDHETYQNVHEICKMLLDSLCPWGRHVVDVKHLGLHAIDILHKSLSPDDYQYRKGPRAYVMPSAVEISEAGIHFKPTGTDNLLDIHFKHGVLSMPVVRVDEGTEKRFLNLMAFERLHPSAGNDVTTYVIFLENLINSAKDVALLRSKKIIESKLNSDEEVAKLLNKTLNKGGVMSPSSTLHDVQRQVNAYRLQRWNRWRANFIQTYLRNPWVFISLIGSVILLVATLMQTVYTVVPFYKSS